MPARKRRLGLKAQERVFVESETRKLQAAAERASALLDRLGRLRDEAGVDRSPDAASAATGGARKGWWPFGRKADPVKDRAAELKAELEEAVKGRPQASTQTAARTGAATPQAGRKVGTAA